MYKIEKRFTFPMGHRLSKHDGRCFSMHGHNFTVLVGIKSPKLNRNDMVMDFSHLKSVVSGLLDGLDHCMLLNETDSDIEKKLEDLGMRVMTVPYDPTAEKLAEMLYTALSEALSKQFPNVLMDYVTVYENEDSKATYCIEPGQAVFS
jgi:6-pyruvoyltetrahydropterin/6-carboxytetrahydropterin synthase